MNNNWLSPGYKKENKKGSLEIPLIIEESQESSEILNNLYPDSNNIDIKENNY